MSLLIVIVYANKYLSRRSSSFFRRESEIEPDPVVSVGLTSFIVSPAAIFCHPPDESLNGE
jgi:hypothetical protein